MGLTWGVEKIGLYGTVKQGYVMPSDELICRVSILDVGRPVTISDIQLIVFIDMGLKVNATSKNWAKITS